MIRPRTSPGPVYSLDLQPPPPPQKTPPIQVSAWCAFLCKAFPLAQPHSLACVPRSVWVIPLDTCHVTSRVMLESSSSYQGVSLVPGDQDQAQGRELDTFDFWLCCLLSWFCACTQSLSCVRLFETPWTVAHQAPLSMGILQARMLEWVAMPSVP